jgi:hypothetical protein
MHSLQYIVEVKQRGRMPYHIELVAGKHDSGASDRSIAALLFQQQHKALTIKIVYDEKSGFIQIDCHQHL